MNQPFKIIRKFKLDNYLKNVLEKSTSNVAPYHNFYHVMCMVKNVYNISKSLDFNDESTRPLLIAALFHDFNHSMGAHNDAWNVAEAIKSYKLYSKENKETNLKVINIIEATQYPYVIPEDQLSLEQKIIRDADLMQTFESNYLQQNWMGLSVEMKTDLLSSLKGSEKFWNSVKFHTDYAQALSEEVMPSKFQDVEYLINLLS